jgi:cell division initiation protein
MLTLNDIINASFRKSNFSGYRTEDVDNFLDEVKDSYDLLIKKNVEQKEANESLTEQNNQLQKKLEVLAAKIEEYRTEEDEIKNALVSAQKLGDASVREARHKAEIIIKDANIKAERIISGTKEELVAQSQEFEQLKQTVSDFRSRLLSAYKEHLTLIDALPTAPKTAPSAPAEEPEQMAEEDFPPEEDVDIPVDFAQEAADEDETVDESDQVDDPLFNSQATQSFHLNVSNFDKGPEKEDTAVDHDMRYDVIKFGDNYDIAEDNDSPIGIFNRKQ